MKMHILTFDPVSLAEADFALSLGRVRSSGYKDSTRDSAVEAPPLTCSRSSCAGRSRPGGRKEARWRSWDWSLKLKAPSRNRTTLMNAIYTIFFVVERNVNGYFRMELLGFYLKMCRTVRSHFSVFLFMYTHTHLTDITFPWTEVII